MMETAEVLIQGTPIPNYAHPGDAGADLCSPRREHKEPGDPRHGKGGREQREENTPPSSGSDEGRTRRRRRTRTRSTSSPSEA